MKLKIIYALSTAVALAMTISACAGNQKAEASKAKVQATEQSAKTSDMLTAQKQALMDAGLVTNFDKTVFIDFNATWCGPCKVFAPIFEQAAEKFAGKAIFVAVDVDQYGEVADAFGVQAIPTLIIIRPDGQKKRYVGTAEIVGDNKFDKIVTDNIR